MMLIILSVLLILSLVLLICYGHTFYSPYKGADDHHRLPSGTQVRERREEMLRLIDALLAISCEEVEILSADGLRLHGHYYHQQEGAPVDLCFHGYRGTYIRDFSGGAQVSLKQGHNVLLVDQRAHGKSQGHSICFGIRESEDCLQWINYLLCRFGEETRINLMGVSMGAATVLMASALPLPEQVKHIVADCPYSTVPAIIKRVCERKKLPGLLYPFISLSARLFVGIDLRDGDCLQAVKKSKVPILLIHGEADRVVPCEMSREIQQENPDLVQLHSFPEAGHGLSYLVDPHRYEALVKDFLSA